MEFCSPNDHVNCAQSTNDAYPSAFRYAFIRMNRKLEKSLKDLIDAFKAVSYTHLDVYKRQPQVKSTPHFLPFREELLRYL